MSMSIKQLFQSRNRANRHFDAKKMPRRLLR
jgi:hypothetical protein